jgi:hypothetical protein
MDFISETSKRLTIEALTNLAFETLVVKFPWMQYKIISRLVRSIIGYSLEGVIEKGVLIINDRIAEREVDKDVKNLKEVYKKAKEINEKTTQEEIDEINRQQIEAARRLIRLRRL